MEEKGYQLSDMSFFASDFLLVCAKMQIVFSCIINPFHTIGLFLYLLKTPKKYRLFSIIRP